MFDDLSESRKQEIRSIQSEEEYAKLTPHEMAYYRLTEPLISKSELARLASEQPPQSFEELIEEFNKRHSIDSD